MSGHGAVKVRSTVSEPMDADGPARVLIRATGATIIKGNVTHRICGDEVVSMSDDSVPSALDAICIEICGPVVWISERTAFICQVKWLVRS